MCDGKVKERGRRLTPELICGDGAGIICNGLSTLRKEEEKKCIYYQNPGRYTALISAPRHPRADVRHGESEEKIMIK